MDRRSLIEYCLTLPGAYEDYPFADDVWTAMRHTAGRKIFALLYERDGQLCINVKCDPMTADFLRGAYDWVIPGYHMNKTHWNTLLPARGASEAEVYAMIDASYELTKKTVPAPRRKEDAADA